MASQWQPIRGQSYYQLGRTSCCLFSREVGVPRDYFRMMLPEQGCPRSRVPTVSLTPSSDEAAKPLCQSHVTPPSLSEWGRQFQIRVAAGLGCRALVVNFVSFRACGVCRNEPWRSERRGDVRSDLSLQLPRCPMRGASSVRRLQSRCL